MADTKKTKRFPTVLDLMRPRDPLRVRGDGDERKKVLLSVGEDDLKVIDANAEKLGMNRSAYLVAMGLQGRASLFDAIARLTDDLATVQHELRRFQADNSAWRAENERMHKHSDDLRQRLNNALAMLEAAIDDIEESGVPKSTIKTIRSAIASLRV